MNIVFVQKLKILGEMGKGTLEEVVKCFVDFGC